MMLLLPGGLGGDPSAFQSKHASYVAVSAIATLAIALLLSLWESDVSGSTALLGVMGVYLSNVELTVLYLVFSPASILIDIIRTARATMHPPWLLLLVEMGLKVVGSYFAYSVYRMAMGGAGAGGGYAAVPIIQPARGGLAGAGGSGNHGNLVGGGGGGGGGYTTDPFASYAPPTTAGASSNMHSGMPQGSEGGGLSTMYQPSFVPTSMTPPSLV